MSHAAELEYGLTQCSLTDVDISRSIYRSPSSRLQGSQKDQAADGGTYSPTITFNKVIYPGMDIIFVRIA